MRVGLGWVGLGLGQTFLNNLSLDTDSFGTDVLALGIMVVFFQLIAYICLKFQRASR
jgi:hypothetical protein